LSAHLAQVNATLDPHERLACMVAVSDRWLPETGFTTPTLKIKRNVIEERYSPSFESWLASGQNVIFETQ
jgi:long-chain acyl-CoA synthetase